MTLADLARTAGALADAGDAPAAELTQLLHAAETLPGPFGHPVSGYLHSACALLHDALAHDEADLVLGAVHGAAVAFTAAAAADAVERQLAAAGE